MENENRFVTERIEPAHAAVGKFAAQDASLVQQMQFGEEAWLQTRVRCHANGVRRILAGAYGVPRSQYRSFSGRLVVSGLR